MKKNNKAYVVSNASQIQETLEAFGHDEKVSKNILIVGGGNIGFNLAKNIEETLDAARVKIIEKKTKSNKTITLAMLQEDMKQPEKLRRYGKEIKADAPFELRDKTKNTNVLFMSKELAMNAQNDFPNRYELPDPDVKNPVKKNILTPKYFKFKFNKFINRSRYYFRKRFSKYKESIIRR